MRALWLGAAMVAMELCGGPALADEPALSHSAGYSPAYASAVSYDWSGIYFGGQLGAANARNEWTNDFTLEKVEQSTTGLAGGAHAGLQKQWSWIVATFGWIDQDRLAPQPCQV